MAKNAVILILWADAHCAYPIVLVVLPTEVVQVECAAVERMRMEIAKSAYDLVRHVAKLTVSALIQCALKIAVAYAC